MLMVDRITSIDDHGGAFGKGQVSAELNIRPDLWFFGCHFKSDPVMPGCLGVDALWQLGGFFLAWLGEPGKGRALGAGKIKFSGQVLPTAKLVSYTLDIKRVISRKLSMVLFNGKVMVDGRTIYTAEDLKVGPDVEFRADMALAKCAALVVDGGNPVDHEHVIGWESRVPGAE